MNKNFALVILVAVIAACVGIISWLLPTKGDADELENKYTISLTNCAKISLEPDRELKLLFKSTDYKNVEGGQSFLTPIVKMVDSSGKPLSFGIPIYGVNYWRYKWANHDLYLYADRIDDQDKFWSQTQTGEEEKFEKIRTILTRENLVKSVTTSDYYLDLQQREEVNGRIYNSITVLRKELDRKIKTGEIKKGDLLSVFVKCHAPPIDTPVIIKQSGITATPPPPPNTKIIVETNFKRIGESNKFVWSKKLADVASQLTIEMKIKGEVIDSQVVTGETEYCFSPGNKVTAKHADVTLEVTLDRRKYSLVGSTTTLKSLYNCTCQ